MNFTNIIDLIQVFANEYCIPSSNVLLLGNIDITRIFNFLHSNLIVSDYEPNENVDIVIGKYLPFRKESFDLISKCLNNPEVNLFRFIYDSIVLVNEYLDIKTKVIISSTIDIDHTLKSQDKVFFGFIVGIPK